MIYNDGAARITGHHGPFYRGGAQTLTKAYQSARPSAEDLTIIGKKLDGFMELRSPWRRWTRGMRFLHEPSGAHVIIGFPTFGSFELVAIFTDGIVPDEYLGQLTHSVLDLMLNYVDKKEPPVAKSRLRKWLDRLETWFFEKTDPAR